MGVPSIYRCGAGFLRILTDTTLEDIPPRNLPTDERPSSPTETRTREGGLRQINVPRPLCISSRDYRTSLIQTLAWGFWLV